jgi:uncharacterized protein (DUF427 family)
MQAIWNDIVIAESSATVMIEGNHYFPFEAVNMAYLRDSNHTTTCSWKGLANYYSIEVNGKLNENAAWIYKTPKAKAAEIAGYVAFWHGVKVVE